MLARKRARHSLSVPMASASMLVACSLARAPVRGEDAPAAPAELLTRAGESLPVPAFPTANAVRMKGGFTLLTLGGKRVPRADGDEAIQGLLQAVTRRYASSCRGDGRREEASWIVDVGGLYGDFSMSAASAGCRTMVFEPQPIHAQLIAASALRNRFGPLVRVHNAAVSANAARRMVTGRTAGQTSWVEANSLVDASATLRAAATTLIAGEQLDAELAGDNVTVLLLKVDVEGSEDDVLLTAVRLFQTGRVRHAVFEYTPAQFVGRGTNYSSFLPRLYAMGARNCYAAHRRRSQFFAIPHPAVAAGILDRFYMVNKRIRMQTDIYCSFCSDELFPDAVRTPLCGRNIRSYEPGWLKL